ncbi:MAG: peptidylprolyl isomerase [Bacilli bacterium]|nr:peptidylprolyl isomerase [Bacilli bacterium]
MKNKIGIIVIGIIILILLVFLVINKKPKESSDDLMLSGKYNVEIIVKDYGKIKLELDADTAPITVTNFINLVNRKYYDGTKFHRIMEGFMIQGGAGSENLTPIKGEFSNNGIKNDISHVRGVISMARTSVPDSATSQFFIVHEDSKFLDGNYAAFGHVTEGIEVVDKIAEDSNPTDDNGTIRESEQPIIESIRVIE